MAVLGVWAYRHIMGFEDNIFKITPMAIDINDTRSLHAAQMVRDALRNMNVPIANAEVLVLGGILPGGCGRYTVQRL